MTEHDLLHRAVRNRPPKAASVQFLRAYPKAAVIPYQKFQPVATRICEEEHMAAGGIAFQPVAYQTVKPVEPLAHVR